MNGPEEKKTVTIQVWDLETDEIIDMEIDQEALDAMDEEQRKYEKARDEAYERDREVWDWLFSDD